MMPFCAETEMTSALKKKNTVGLWTGLKPRIDNKVSDFIGPSQPDAGRQ